MRRFIFKQVCVLCLKRDKPSAKQICSALSHLINSHVVMRTKVPNGQVTPILSKTFIMNLCMKNDRIFASDSHTLSATGACDYPLTSFLAASLKHMLIYTPSAGYCSWPLLCHARLCKLLSDLLFNINHNDIYKVYHLNFLGQFVYFSKYNFRLTEYISHSIITIS